MKKTLYLFALITAFSIALTSCGNKKADTDSKDVAEDQNSERFKDTNIKDDTEFAVGTADDGMLEVELGKLAVANAATDEVKQFGQSMVNDHSKANDELKAMAVAKNITLPSVMSDKNKKKYEDLAKINGLEFDKEYSKSMIKDHKEDINEFKKEAEKGNDPDLKSWAAGKVAVLEHHLMMAENAHEAVKDRKK